MKFGMQVVMTAQPGKGGELGELMLKASEVVAELDGCGIYIVQVSVEDADKVLVAEVWESSEAHKTALANPAVLELIMKARPLIAEMEHHIAKPLGGKGL